MRSQPGGNLTAVLMFVVLLAVPLLAVFGIPEIVPASNSLSEQHEAFEDIRFSPSTYPDGESASYSSSVQPDIYASLQNGQSDSQSRNHSPVGSNSEQIRNPFLQLEETDQIFRDQPESLSGISATEALAEWELVNTKTASRTDSAASENPFSGKSSFDLDIEADKISHSEVGHSASQKSPLTWRSAVRRLNDLGIRKFRLEPGSREHEFHFSCFLTPLNNLRVTHRFEAEAEDPLRAVEKVLKQITLWQQER